MTNFSNETQTLATLLHLSRRSRQAVDEAELNFIVVNETHALVPYRQAVLWRESLGVVALSGVVTPEANAPYVLWLSRVFKHLKSHHPSTSPKILDVADFDSSDYDELHEWLPTNVLWVPMPTTAQHFYGDGLLLAREESWQESELILLQEWASIIAPATAVLRQQSIVQQIWGRLTSQNSKIHASDKRLGVKSVFSNLKWWLLLVLVGLMFMPVSLTILAPADLVPLNPSFIRAPLEGVIDRILVMPNQVVHKDEPLFEFDQANIQNKLHVAVGALDTARAEYRQKAQQALFDVESKAQLASLQGQIAEKVAEVAYLRKLESRGVVVSPREGVAFFDDPTEWVGRPVVTGERVMIVADAHDVEVEAWVSPADAVSFADGGLVTVYLNADPLHPVKAALRYVAHEATQRPDSHYAYRVRATLVDHENLPRVGLKGTAKIEGARVSLAYWILRRPLSAFRVWLGA